MVSTPSVRFMGVSVLAGSRTCKSYRQGTVRNKTGGQVRGGFGGLVLGGLGELVRVVVVVGGSVVLVGCSTKVGVTTMTDGGAPVLSGTVLSSVGGTSGRTTDVDGAGSSLSAERTEAT